jgi:hypothetical protein
MNTGLLSSSPLWLSLLPAALLAAWLLMSLARTLREMKAFDGFEGMHFEPEDLAFKPI